jgi:sec-independent protein translocase protein TatC
MSATPVPTEPVPEKEMSLLDHLRELRNRITIAALSVAICTALSFTFVEQLLKILIDPYCRALAIDPCRLTQINPTESLFNVFNVALTVGLSLALPVVLYQIIAFVLPGLYPHEKRYFKIGLPVALILFLLGVGFAWFFFLPNALQFLIGLFPTVFSPQITADTYIPFVTTVLFWMGLSFEMPIVLLLLAKVNVISARVLTQNWRYAIVGIAILAAVITPTPDPINMGMVMAPLLVLYGISIGLVALVRRNATVPAMLDSDEKVKDA